MENPQSWNDPKIHPKWALQPFNMNQLTSHIRFCHFIWQISMFCARLKEKSVYQRFFLIPLCVSCVFTEMFYPMQIKLNCEEEKRCSSEWDDAFGRRKQLYPIKILIMRQHVCHSMRQLNWELLLCAEMWNTCVA